MEMTYFIVDDDAGTRRILHNIIEDCELGEVLGEASGGLDGIPMILDSKPDVVLIDLLMKNQDGIEIIKELKGKGFLGRFIMISQIVNKEMVGQAYQAGIDFFIHKPINRVEVNSVLMRVREQSQLNRSITAIKQSLESFNSIHSDVNNKPKEKLIHDAAYDILMNLGISGESGSLDIIAIVEYVIKLKKSPNLPLLREIYEVRANQLKSNADEIAKEIKAIEQRIRRTILVALTNLASIGLTDYSNPKFEYYAPLYFDFEDVRIKMNELEQKSTSGQSKVNIKKFLQVFIWETINKMNH